MGGASSNAAICLKAINTIEQKQWDYKTLINIGKSFGSDIAFFMKGGIQTVSGIGDILTEIIPPNPRYFTLIYPTIECSTKEIYNHFDNMISTHKKTILSSSNNLLPVVLNYNQEMKDIYVKLSKEISSPIQLTGSGSTFFIEFKSKEDSIQLKNQLLKQFPNYYIKTTEAIYNNHSLTLS